MMTRFALVAAAATAQNIDINPNVDKIPGGSQLQELVDGVAGAGLLIAGGSLALGAAVWALASHSGNPTYTATGKRAAVICVVAAVLIGAASALINWGQRLGEGIAIP